MHRTKHSTMQPISKNFHEGSHCRRIIPVLVSTKAPTFGISDEWFDDDVSNVQRVNDHSLADVISQFARLYGSDEKDNREWIETSYKPTPTICEAAQALYGIRCPRHFTFRCRCNQSHKNSELYFANYKSGETKQRKIHLLCYGRAGVREDPSWSEFG